MPLHYVLHYLRDLHTPRQGQGEARLLPNQARTRTQTLTLTLTVHPHQVPLHYCVFTLFCIVGGAMVYNEFEHLTAQGWVTFSCGGACCLLGVVVLTTPYRLVCSAAPISCHFEKQACTYYVPLTAYQVLLYFLLLSTCYSLLTTRASTLTLLYFLLLSPIQLTTLFLLHSTYH